jgi:signal transduction histidine kinase
MGTHGTKSTPARLARRAAREQATSPRPGKRGQSRLRLPDWPVAWRLFTAVVAALVMGLVFGGLRVAAAEDSAGQLSRTQQLAGLNGQLTTVVNDLERERDATIVAFLGGRTDPSLAALASSTRRDVVSLRPSLSAVLAGRFPATLQADALAASRALAVGSMTDLGGLAVTAPDPDSIIDDYGAVIADATAVQGKIALGVTDASLTSDVQMLGALSQAKDQVSQQQVLLDEVLTVSKDGYALAVGFLDFNTETRLRVAYQDALADISAYQGAAPARAPNLLDSMLVSQPGQQAREIMTDNLESSIFQDASGSPPTSPAGGWPLVSVSGKGIPLSQVITSQVTLPGVSTRAQLRTAWDTGMGAKLGVLQATESQVAASIVTRASQLRQAAQRTALVSLVITVAVLLVVMLTALLVTRSVVMPLRRLRAAALNVASAELPERVRLIAEDPDSATGIVVEPIDVPSRDEIGQVARAFDQVHAEAVRLAGEQSLLRATFSAMFVSLSRRLQSQIDRLALMIDTLEQAEEDPERLGNLFSMDHLVTRMRRNSATLLLLGGHDGRRQWSESVPLADVTRAAASEIEHYKRVAVTIPAGLSVVGPAVSDVIHLLAELLENATLFSAKDTAVQVGLLDLTSGSGGAVIEVADRGIGISETRLAEMNVRLDMSPTVDASVARHMGLFAVARLAERHRIRVRLRPVLPEGLSVLVWLPDGVLERGRGERAGRAWARSPALAPGAPPRAADREPAEAGPFVHAPADGPLRSGPVGPDVAGAGAVGPGAVDTAYPPPGRRTSASLPLRVPGGSLAGRGAADGHAAGRAAADGPGSTADGGTLSRRSPAHARRSLGGFQRGARRAGERAPHSGADSQASRQAEGPVVELRTPSGSELAGQRLHGPRARGGTRGRSLRRRRAARVVGVAARIPRRATRRHHRGTSQPDARRVPHLPGRAAGPGAGRNGRRPAGHQGDQRRLEPVRARR